MNRSADPDATGLLVSPPGTLYFRIVWTAQRTDRREHTITPAPDGQQQQKEVWATAPDLLPPGNPWSPAMPDGSAGCHRPAALQVVPVVFRSTGNPQYAPRLRCQSMVCAGPRAATLLYASNWSEVPRDTLETSTV